MSRARIIVGADGSVGARTATQWAVDECRLRGCTLLIVTVIPADPGAPAAEWDGGRPAHGLADQLLTAAAAAASVRQPGVPVTTLIDYGPPVQALLELSLDADMLVVGTRGRSDGPALLGSVSQRVAERAHCPVAVIPGSWKSSDAGNLLHVAVGVSSGLAHATAAQFAHDEAKARGVTLQTLPDEDGHSGALRRAAGHTQLVVLSRRRDDDTTMLPGVVGTPSLPYWPCPVIYVGAAYREHAYAPGGDPRREVPR